MAKQYWLMKSEPDVYGWDNLVQDGSGIWDGVRNHSAKLNMQAMTDGEAAIFYNSNIGKECVGFMQVKQAAFPDPTAADRTVEQKTELQSLMRISYDVVCMK